MYNPFSDDDQENEEDNVVEFGSSNPEEPPNVDEPKKEEPVMGNKLEKPNNKCNIIDLYWLINNKFFNKEKLGPNEVPLICIGYNADFLNLRITFHVVNGDSNPPIFVPTGINKNNSKSLCTVNVFSETAHNLYHNITKGTKDVVEITNFERLFNSSWEPTPCAFKIDKKEGTITIKTSINSEIYTYVFTDWQIQVLLNSLKFMFNGDSWKSSLMVK